MGFFNNFLRLRVRLMRCYRTHRSSRYCGTGLLNLQKIQEGIEVLYPFPGYCGHGRTKPTDIPGTDGCECRTELTDVPGTSMDVLQNLRKFFEG